MSSQAKSEWECVRASLSSKASPYQLRPWVQLSQTLDGRDKITKVIQYTARFLAFYYDSLVRYYQTWKQRDRLGAEWSPAYYQFQATRFRKLQKALSDARKAFGLGRSWVEYQKLKDTGVLQWLYMHIESFKQSATQLPHSILSQVNAIIPNSIPSNVSFTLASFRSYLDSMPRTQVVGRTHPQPLPWRTIVHSTRLASMVAFWAFDNLAFLSSAGFLDTVSLTLPFIQKGKDPNKNHSIHVGPIASRFANRIFFFSSLINLVTSWNDWKEHQQKALQEAWDEYSRHHGAQALSDTKTEEDTLQEPLQVEKRQMNPQEQAWKHNWDKVQRQHSALFLNLLKVRL
jgi:hypothetical protein